MLAYAEDESDHGHHQDNHEEIEEIVVQATRSRRRLQDEPTRVEVLAGEEIEEKRLYSLHFHNLVGACELKGKANPNQNTPANHLMRAIIA